jgi:hypothetical protein
MIRDDKQRIIGKLININSDKFTVELLNQSINFTVNGYDDIYQYAQINGYVILPYQDFYIVAEIFGVREKDADRSWHGKTEQVLSKANSVKYLDISPVGTLQNKKFKYGLSIFPTLYSDVLYIKKEELDIIFELTKETEDIPGTEDSTKLKLLEIGSSTIFPDYKVKLDINGFFGAHSAVLGNTGSGKSCTISAMIQNLFKKEDFSAVGASFVFFDVNGEYHKAFSQIKNTEIDINYLSLNELKEKSSFKNSYNGLEIRENIKYQKFILPHWFLNIDEWALLLQASERTQLPILRKALGIASLIADSGNKVEYTKQINFILATAIGQVLRSDLGSPSKRDRIISLLNKYKTEDIKLSKRFTYFDEAGNEKNEIIYDRNRAECTINNCLKIHFGGLIGVDQLLQYIEQTDEDGNYVFLPPDIKLPEYSDDLFFNFEILEDALDLAILHEEAYGNKQIRDYCSSLITRFKSLKTRQEFDFLTANQEEFTKTRFNDIILGQEGIAKKTQITIIDLNSIEDEIVEVISCVISRLIFEKLKIVDPRNGFPVNLVLEEAHRYISYHSNGAFSEATKIFDRIAKEGRKYGLFLLISSQRPSELSKTVLSQCSNFIIHRIQNPEDLSQIRQMTPHISANILSRLPSIPRQHALVFGHSVQIPTLFKVAQACPTPYSSDNDIATNWFVPKSTGQNQSNKQKKH